MKSELVLPQITNMIDNADRLTEAGLEGARDGLYVAGEHILGVSNQHVPHEEGTLQRSGGVSQNGNIVGISYDTDYAVRQHEDMSLHHDEGRNAKFLENALASERDTALAIVAQSIKGAMGL